MSRRRAREHNVRMTNDDLRKAAKRRLKAKRDFHLYLGIWAAVTLLLVAIWW